ncbi:nuclear transport factor 2 family protein [Sphingobium aquiterrae]|uniref:nuclear transport factor 2 family protein n=1 Tax=Sphingobium aquiterrae TaxID=2038656 RepID=UPI003016618E
MNRTDKPDNLAARLVRALGDLTALELLYTDDVVFHLPSSLVDDAIRGKANVMAMHRQVWTSIYHPVVEVEILDTLAQDSLSAARFVYRARFKSTNEAYQNEYTFFVRGREGMISEVFEGVDSHRFVQLRPSVADA